jgi:hypothetical protein
LDKCFKIGVFISGHGFGHGTRTCAILKEITRFIPCEFDILSDLPTWFFKQNLPSLNFTLHNVKTDIGLVQKTPFLHDLDETVNQLKEFVRFNSQEYIFCERLVRRKKHDLLISDISPLGLEVGFKTGVPNVLIENFTWDWIYQLYTETALGILPIIEVLEKSYSYANLRIKVTPFCDSKNKSIKTPPVSREVIQTPNEIREKLKIEQEMKVILLTTGGITKRFDLIDKMKRQKDVVFITSGDIQKTIIDKNIISIPMKSDFHYPDLVNSVNLVAGKAGYGTIAECWSTNTPLLGSYRADFRESEVLLNFASKELEHDKLTVDDLEKMDWIETALSTMKDLNEKSPKKINGTHLASKSILNFIL